MQQLLQPTAALPDPNGGGPKQEELSRKVVPTLCIANAVLAAHAVLALCSIQLGEWMVPRRRAAAQWQCSTDYHQPAGKQSQGFKEWGKERHGSSLQRSSHDNLPASKQILKGVGQGKKDERRRGVCRAAHCNVSPVVWARLLSSAVWGVGIHLEGVEDQGAGGVHHG